MCLKCYNMEVLNAEMSCFLAKRQRKSYVNLAENNNLTNELIIKWRVFEPTLHYGFQTTEIVTEMWKTGKTLF